MLRAAERLRTMPSVRKFTPILLLVVLAVPGAALAKTKPKTLVATLTGAAEQPAGAPKGSARATITFDSSKKKVCWEFRKLKGVSSPTAAHIHLGSRGKAGPITIPFGGKYKSHGCQTGVDRALIGQVLRHPSLYYVNIHNSAFPAGAVRGQLKKP
jgi:hypothetical protein